MNLLIDWCYDYKGEAFERLLVELQVKYCAYFVDNKTDTKTFSEAIEYEQIYLYHSIDKFIQNQEKMIPLDSELLEKMSKYENTAMDIIYRWRRSISTREGYKDIKDIYYSFLRYWNDFIIKKEIQMVILSNLPHIPHFYIIYALSKIYNIPIVVQIKMGVLDNGLQNKYFATDIDRMDTFFFQNYNKIKDAYTNISEENIEIHEGYKEYFEEYSKYNNSIKRVIIYEPKKTIGEMSKLYLDRSKVYIKQKKYKILLNKMLYLVKTQWRSKQLLSYAERQESQPELNAKYVFFPLHFQPEATTLPHAGRYVDQLLIIQMVSAYLPDGVLLYVKEHPAFWKLKERYECVSEVRSKEFYDAIIKLNNVKLINHEYSSLDLIDNCCCVVTCTGTAGLEAAFKNKPILIFGNMVYSYLPGAYKINSSNDFKIAINKIFYGIAPAISKKDLLLFFKALENVSVTVGLSEGNIDNAYSRIKLNVSSMRTTEALLKYIKIVYLELCK